MTKILDVTSVGNARVKAIAALGMKKERAATGLFVVEGLQLVGFGVEAGWELVTLVVRKDAVRDAFMKRLEAAAGEILQVNAAVLEKLTRRDNPQGVVGVFRQKLPVLAKAGVAEGVWVVLEQVRDPGNLGTIIRTVDAVGAQGVILVGDCTDVWAPECVRATMGSIFHVALARCTLDEFVAWRSGKGLMVGTHLRGKVDYREVAGMRKKGQMLLLAMGTEQSGLSDMMADACDVLTKIAMRGRAESLNLAMATGVMLYEIYR